MTKPLLPAVDAAGRLREAAFALLLRDRQPVTVAAVSHATGLSEASARRSVTALANAGWLDLDTDGRVAGAAGLSLIKGAHRLTLEGAAFRTWCAYDALGIPAALVSDGSLETACGHCGRSLSVAFRSGMPTRSGPEVVWLAEGSADLRASFCTPTVLLCSDEHGRAWAETQGGNGDLLSLKQASRRGGADWAGCADAAKRLA